MLDPDSWSVWTFNNMNEWKSGFIGRHLILYPDPVFKHEKIARKLFTGWCFVGPWDGRITVVPRIYLLI